MNKLRVTYLALGAFVFAASCSKEAAEPDVFDWGDGKIHFRPSISNVVASRAQDITLDALESFQVTCFNSESGNENSADYLSPHFENATFVRNSGSSALPSYISSPYEEPHDWPANSGFIRFFAFSPSLKEMDGSPVLKGTDKSYSLDGFRVNSDISRQFDFITAKTAGERWTDFVGGVELNFSHQLCQVELKAWGDGSAFDFEIAGVRIGNPVVEGSFVFADNSAPDDFWGWNIEGEGIKDKVEYLYRSSYGSDLEGRPEAGDRTFRINQSEHNTAESAASIMGLGGCAMVIPTVNARWEGLKDPDNNNVPYRTGRMYFSILTRVTDSSTGEKIYPYPDDKTGMTVVIYAVDASGNIMTRLYTGETPGQYFTDEALTQPFVAGEGMEIKDFGWAAVPVDADWKAGKRYVYTLDYSEGIGLHVPEDPEPGKPITGKSPNIGWGVSVEDWNYAEKNENYDPDLEVPGEN